MRVLTKMWSLVEKPVFERVETRIGRGIQSCVLSQYQTHPVFAALLRNRVGMFECFRQEMLG